MPPEPQVTADGVTFTVPGAAGFDELCLEVDRSLGGRIPFARCEDGWNLTFRRPDVTRLEYQLWSRRAGHDHSGTDPANPRSVPGPFGPKSEIVFPDYREPPWMAATVGGDLTEVVVPGPLETSVPVVVFAPHGLEPDQPAPLLIAHDGTDLAERGSLLRWACATRRPLRLALLDPPIGYRNAWYAANPTYAEHVATDIVPALRADLAVSSVVGLGVSLGAVAIMTVHQQRPFDAMVLQSGSFFRRELDGQESGWAEFDQVCAAVRRWSADAGPASRALIQVGTVEENRGNNEKMSERLAAQGFTVDLELFRDGHNVIAWRDAWSPALDRLMEAVP